MKQHMKISARSQVHAGTIAETENAPARQHLEPIPENPPELSTVSRRRWFSMQGVPCHKAAGMVFSLGVVVTLLVVVPILHFAFKFL
ncbi:hypothetical protein D910_12132 [Dendroctonus ponderosae]